MQKRGISIFIVLTLAFILLISSASAVTLSKKTITGRAINTNIPIGWLDTVNLDAQAKGWACDLDNPSSNVRIHIYIDNPAGVLDSSGNQVGFVEQFFASELGEQTIRDVCGGTPSHRFTFAIPDKFKDNTVHTMYAYAINVDVEGNTNGDNMQLQGSPKQFQVSCPTEQILQGGTCRAGMEITTIVHSCSGNTAIATISWTGSPQFLDISTDSTFTSHWNKAVSGSSTTAPAGFGVYSGNLPALVLSPGTVYYARLYNSGHSAIKSFSAPSCGASVTPTCGTARNNGVNDYLSTATQTAGTLCGAGTPQTEAGVIITNNNAGQTFSSANTVSWKCAGTTSTITCTATHPALISYTCAGAVPTGDLVIPGLSTTTTPANGVSWEYTTSNPPPACKWTCRAGNQINSARTGCVASSGTVTGTRPTISSTFPADTTIRANTNQPISTYFTAIDSDQDMNHLWIQVWRTPNTNDPTNNFLTSITGYNNANGFYNGANQGISAVTSAAFTFSLPTAGTYYLRYAVRDIASTALTESWKTIIITAPADSTGSSCTGSLPSSNLFIRGASTSTGVWSYTETNPPGACQWTCPITVTTVNSAHTDCLPSPPSTPCPSTAQVTRTLTGTSFTCSCSSQAANAPGGSVWGTGTYTDDSVICIAARHSGLTLPGEVTYTMTPGQSSYSGLTRNGVTSSNYASWLGSFTIAGSSSGTPSCSSTNPTGTCPAGQTCTSGTCVTPTNPITPTCGTARNNGVNDYLSTATQTAGTLCGAGTPQTEAGVIITNNNAGQTFSSANTVSWKCAGTTSTITCTATHPALTIINPPVDPIPSGPSKITDPSIRGYTANTADSKQQLILGFNTLNSAMLYASTRVAEGAANAQASEKFTTILNSIIENKQVPDADSTSFGFYPGISAGTYTFNVYPTNPADQGQTVLSNSGGQLDLSQFSGRGWVDSNNPLILGFSIVGGPANVILQASPSKLTDAGLSPTLSAYTYALYKDGVQQATTVNEQSAITLQPGSYTIATLATGTASGFMLMEINKASGAKITDPSIRGYTANTAANDKQLILGFYNTQNASVSARILDGWSSFALSKSKITTTLRSITENKQVPDADASTSDFQSGLAAGTYTFNVYPTNPADQGQTVLSNLGGQVDLSQFSGRGWVNSSNPLILGFSVRNSATLRLQASPSKIVSAGITPTLTSFSYRIYKVGVVNSPANTLVTDTQTHDFAFSEGSYTLVLTPTGTASGFMLLEATTVTTSSNAITVATTQATTGQETTQDIATAPGTGVTVNTQGTGVNSAAPGSSNNVACTSGCLSANGQTCHVEGFRSGSRYCDSASRSFTAQKDTDAVCSNDFECGSNLCIENKCVSQGLLQQLLALLRNLFPNG